MIQGTQDPIASAEIVRDAVPDARLEMIEECGHFPWLEQPEKFYALVLGFLEGLRDQASGIRAVSGIRGNSVKGSALDIPAEPSPG